jgi:DNA repair protein SbcD/Mre11
MRLLHTSDWHLGRETYRVSRRPDHEAVIDEIVALAAETDPHLIIHSGDLFDGPRPAYDDLSLGADALQRLAAIAPVVVVCGNHDSPPLFRLFTQLLGADAAIRFVDVARLPEAGGILEFAGDGDERIRVASLPFIHANRLVTGFEDPSLRTALYADRVAAIEQRLAQGLVDTYDPARDILVFAAHLYVGGATYGRSERALHVSDTYASRPEAIPAVSYAALGHIHKPQALPGGTAGRYAGSPIQLDFGEEGEEKVTVIVEAAPGRAARIEPRPIVSGRRLLRVAGSLSEIPSYAEAARGKLVHVTVRSDEPIPDVTDQIGAMLPEAVILEVAEDIASRRLSILTETETATVAEPSMQELFHQYLTQVGTRGSAAADRVLASFEALNEAIDTDTPPVLVGADALSLDEDVRP